MKTFAIFNLFISLAIMSYLRIFIICWFAVSLTGFESCSKDSDLVSDQNAESNTKEIVELEKSGQEKIESTTQEDEDLQENEPQQEQKSTENQQLKSVEDIVIFPSNHPLHKNISNSPIDHNSAVILENIGWDVNLFADFGDRLWKGEPIGMPYITVGRDQPKVPITFRGNEIDDNYGHESDQGPFPIPLDAPKESNFYRDGHVLTVDVDNGMLYELYNAEQKGDGWEASAAAVFNLNTVEFRRDGWTSTDAAGLPVFPLLVRYDETQTGEIDHPIRFTLERSKIYEGYVHPARHLITGHREDNLLPMGGVLRLKADFDISSFSQTNQVILKALKKHGLILSDVGPSMYLKGDPNENWDTPDIRELMKVKVSDFDVIELGEIKTR